MCVTYRTGLRCLLDRDVEGLVAVDDGEGDRLVELVEERRRNRSERRHDRQLGRIRAEPQGADAETVAAVGISHRPGPIDEHPADPMNGALGETELPRQVGQAERAARSHQIEDAQRRVDTGGGRPRFRCLLSDLVAHDVERVLHTRDDTAGCRRCRTTFRMSRPCLTGLGWICHKSTISLGHQSIHRTERAREAVRGRGATSARNLRRAGASTRASSTSRSMSRLEGEG